MFKEFLIESENSDLEKTLNSIPLKHKKLIHGYNFKFQGNNTLSGDKEHVGELDPNKKKITVAAPWRYSREITTLHEIAHLVWEKLDSSIKNKWKKLVNSTTHGKEVKNKGALKQSPEELFCMTYGSAYAKNPVVTFNNEDWIKFIKNLN